jgi:pimeloyl-ACP methyl ester carboxylesterase
LTILCSRTTPFPAFADTAESLRRGDPLDVGTVVAAELDLVGTPDEMRALADSIPGADLVLAPNASHMSQFLHPEALAGRVAGSPAVQR